MATASLNEPGVEVLQQFQAPSPTIRTPVLLPTIVGPCYEIVDPVLSSGEANANALLTTPARFVGEAVGPDITVESGKRRVTVSVNNGAPQTYDLPTPAPAASYSLDLAASYLQQNLVGVRFGVTDAGTQLIPESVASGASASLKFIGGDPSSAHELLGIDDFDDITISGSSFYGNHRIPVAFTALPVVKGDINQMDVLEDEIRVYILQGGSLREVLRGQAILRHKFHQSSTMRLDDPDRDPILLDSFPQANYAHQLAALDDGDTDGVTPWLYAKGTNAFLAMGFGLDDQFIVEAKGDQDATDMGAYHGVLGNNTKVVINPSGGVVGPANPADTTLIATVAVAGVVLKLHPTVRLNLTNVVKIVDVDKGDTVQFATEWTAKVGDIDSAALPTWIELYDLQPAGVYAGYAGYTALMDSYSKTAPPYTIDNMAGPPTWQADVSVVSVVTTASEQVAAIAADTAASSLVKATLRGNGSDPVEVMQFYKVGLNVAADTNEDLRLGDLVEEDSGSPSWLAIVVGIDGTDDVNLAIVSGEVPIAAQTFRKKSDVAYNWTIGAVVTDHVLEGTYLSGGRDPVDFAYTPTASAGDECKVRSDLPANTAADGLHVAGALVRFSSANGTFQRGNYIAMARGSAEWALPILDVGSDYLILGMNPGLGANPGGGSGGDLLWPMAGETLTEKAGRSGGWASTAVSATVNEFHTVCELVVTGGTPLPLQPPAIGETLSMTEASGDTWTATVEKVVAHETAADTYYVVLSSVLNTTVVPTEHALPTTGAGGVTWSTYTGQVTAHNLKTLPTAGGMLYLQLSGSSLIQVALDGTEIPQRVADRVNVAIAEGASPPFALVAGDGYLWFDAGGLDATSPYNWRENLGQETTMELSGDALPYVFGTTYELPNPFSIVDYPATNFDHQFIDTKQFAPAFPVKAGDVVWDGSTQIGVVVRTEPLNIGGQVFADSKLIIDRDELVSGLSYENWYIVAMSLTEEIKPASYTPPDRPYPEMSIFTLTQDFLIRQNVAVYFDGTPVTGAAYNIYVQWEGLRLDVTASADDPDLQIIGDTTELEDRLGPTVPENPLAFNIYLALLNAPEVAVAGLGLDEISADAPYGTLDSNARAAEFLENKEDVYVIAVAGQDPIANRMWQLHANVMSQPEMKSERVVIINEKQPTERVPDLLGSGDGESVTGMDNVVAFDPASINVSAVMGAAGASSSWTPDDFRDAGIYLDLASDTKNYLVQSYLGQRITVQVVHAPGQNDDAFWASAKMPALTVGGELVTIYKRGAPIINTGEITETLSALAAGYADRRVLFVQPDYAAVSIDGTEQLIPGFFWGGGIAGMTAGYNPSQPFTNIPIVGYTRPKNSSDKFTKTQMNVGAGGGVYWLIQSTPGGAVFCRHQLTTDLTSIETREFSIVKAVDFTARFLRLNVGPLIGRYNITQGYLDTLTIIIEGALEYLRVGQVVAGAYLSNLVVDETNPDTILIDIVLDPLYPANYIRITLLI